jgi:hypothetical protein
MARGRISLDFLKKIVALRQQGVKVVLNGLLGDAAHAAV